MIWKLADFLGALEAEAQGLSIKEQCSKCLQGACPTNPLTLEIGLSTAAMLILKVIVLLKFKLNWVSWILSGNPTGCQMPQSGRTFLWKLHCTRPWAPSATACHSSQAWLVGEWPLFDRRNWSSAGFCIFPKLVVLANIYISLEEKLPSRQLSNFSVHETQLRSLVNYRSLHAAPQTSDSVGSQKYAFYQVSSTPFHPLWFWGREF